MKPSTEKEIEAGILGYLDTLGGFPMKINLGGKPIQNKEGRMLLIPFKNPFTPKGMADILFLYEGCAFFFEVKTPANVKFIKNSYARLKEGSFNIQNKSYKRLQEQINFIENAKAAGAYGGFVSSIEETKAIIHLAEL